MTEFLSASCHVHVIMDSRNRNDFQVYDFLTSDMIGLNYAIPWCALSRTNRDSRKPGNSEILFGAAQIKETVVVRSNL